MPGLQFSTIGTKRIRWPIVVAVLLVSQLAYTQVVPQDRRVEWRDNVGIEGGIPQRGTMCANVTKSPYNAAGDGTTDDSAAIRDAIEDCPAGQVVYIPKGTYLISQPIRMKSDITVRGDGMGRTILKGSSGFSGSYLVGFEDKNLWFSNILSSSNSISGTASKGSNSLFAASGWSKGDYVLIDQLEDPSGSPMITTDGTNGKCSWCSREDGTRPIGQVAKLAGSSGQLEIPLYYSFDSEHNAQVSRIDPSYIIDSAGLEHLTLDNTLSHDSGQGNYGIVYMVAAVESWVKNVEMINTHKTGLKMVYGYRNVVRGSVIRKSYEYTSNAGYGLYMTFGASGTLIEDNIFYDLAVGVILNGAVSGNVISYNYMTEMKSTTFPNSVRNGVVFHGGHPVMNLFEGNYLGGPGISADLYWGTSSHNTFLRNSIAIDPSKTVGTANISLWKGQTYYNVVGNVLGTDGHETLYESSDLYASPMIYNLDYTNSGSQNGRTADTILRHGNFDYVSNETVWDPGVSDRSIEESYYLNGEPEWWANASWPPIGPVANRGSIPAKYRYENPSLLYEGETGSGFDSAPAPSGLRIESP
jgi:hypothetical protein